MTSSRHMERFSKGASILAPLLSGFSDELEKIANLGTAGSPDSAKPGSPTTMSEIKSTIPRSTMKPAGSYSKAHTDMSASPVASHQPVLSPPPVRG